MIDGIKFETASDCLGYIKEHSDSVDQALVFISGYLQVVSGETAKKSRCRMSGWCSFAATA